MVCYRKVGGLRFVRIGRLNVSFSVTSKQTIASRKAQAIALAKLNWADEMLAIGGWYV